MKIDGFIIKKSFDLVLDLETVSRVAITGNGFFKYLYRISLLTVALRGLFSVRHETCVFILAKDKYQTLR